jgi:para-aminobenzoate synthetase
MSAPHDPADLFRRIAADHPRCFWLDGGGAREWSGRRSILGWLDDDEVSLTYDAATRTVTRHTATTATPVGDDPFTALEAELRAGPPDAHWFGYLGYAARPDLPATTTSTGVPDAVWMTTRNLHFFDHPAPALTPPLAEPRLDPASPSTPPQAEPRLDPGVSGASRGPELGYDAAPEEAPAEGWGGPWSGLAAGARNERRPVGPPHPSAGAANGDHSRHADPEQADIPDDYANAFAAVQEQLHAGNTYELNLTYRVQRVSSLDPATAYLRLRRLNPAPYAGYLQHDVPGARSWLLSSSPERYALVTADRTIETKPIKGTTPRGATPAEDAVLRTRLASEAKFRSENLMIVDLLRNDLSMVCEPGTVEVPSLMAVESYASVHQLVSTVRGRLRDDVTTVGALRSLFPAGSMTGAPKLRTMQITQDVEATARGPYAGAFGWVAADGRADLGVVIRTLTTPGDGCWTLGTGGAITVRSTLEEEHAESRWKADRLLAVFEDE